MSDFKLTRRKFLGTSLAAGASFLVGEGGRSGLWTPAEGAPAIVTSDRLRPQLPSGIQTGDVTDGRALVWSHADRPARLHVEWATTESFRDARAVRGSAAFEGTGFTARADLSGLPAGQEIFYRARFDSLRHPGSWSEPVAGRFRTAPAPTGNPGRPLRIAFSGDCVGQGWGIDRDRGGILTYETMRRAEPDVFIHSGDIIYADQPLQPEVVLDDGTIYRNVMTEAKSKVAESLDEFRGNFAYHLQDEHAQRFHAEVPLIAQWDDHEVVDNWFPGYQLDWDDRYTEKSASLLAARAHQALFEFVPIRRHPEDNDRIYRRFRYGPLLDVFVIDLRSYRGPNTPNMQEERVPEAAMMGNRQLQWLKEELRASRATWKVVASDMPIGLVVPDRRREGQRTYEAWANADDGPPRGRELEIAELLSFMQREGIRNTVWVTADVHYCSANHYSPERAAFTDFDPFWEFVAGPMHAGTFGPNALDGTFGPEVVYQKVAPEPNRPPSDDLQFFGTLDIDPVRHILTAAFHDRTGARLWETELEPVRGP